VRNFGGIKIVWLVLSSMSNSEGHLDEGLLEVFEELDAEVEEQAIPPSELYRDLCRVADEVGHPPFEKEYQTHGTYSHTTMLKWFAEESSWVEMMHALGFEEYESPTRGKEYSDETLVAEVERVKEELGHVPSSTEFNTHSELSPNVVMCRFGEESWPKAMTELGYEYTPPRRETRYRDEEVVAEVERVKEVVGRVPRTTEFKKHSEMALNVVTRRFGEGSWERAMHALGYDEYESPPRGDPRSDKDIAAEVERVKEVLGRVPSSAEFDNQSAMNSTTVTYHFGEGSWTDAMHELGYEEYESRQGGKYPDEEVVAEVERVKEVVGRVPTTTEFRKHASMEPNVVMNRFGDGSWSKAMAELGYDA
jgi:hypothetical protein